MAKKPYPFQMIDDEEKGDEKKTTFKDFMQALAAGVGIVGGLFAFSLILGVIFMDYDPRTMLWAIEEDLRLLFWR